MSIDPRAILGKDVELGDDVEIGPFAILEGHVRIGERTRIYPNVPFGNQKAIEMGLRGAYAAAIDIEQEPIGIDQQVQIEQGAALEVDGESEDAFSGREVLDFVGEKIVKPGCAVLAA